jgi:pimeloyl-ACP methyl ester carboxylesterase
MKQPAELIVRNHYQSNHHGWELELRQCYDPHRLQKNLRPVVIVPGYGMNNFIFGFHPNGLSMEAALAAAGFDVWSVNLRAQGGSRRRGGALHYTIAEVAGEDLPAAIEGVLRHTVADAPDKVDVIGASLGGTFIYAYLALVAESKIGSVVAMGAPMRWDAIHPVLKAAFSVPEILGLIPLRGTQRMARLALPYAVKLPFLLEVYMHPEIIDMTALNELANSVEDPNPRLNRQIGYWIRHKDLVLDGVNVTQALAGRKNPILCILANGDGIVPKEAAISALRAMSSEVKDVIEIGDERQTYAHADLFISNDADKKIFFPIADWLKKNF